MRTLLFFLAACSGDKEPVDSSPPPEDTGHPDTSPPEDTSETGDTAPIETGDSSPPVIIDNDADGVSPDDGDCNDADPLVYPGAVDAHCDGLDADCDGVGEDESILIGETLYADVQSALDAAVSGDVIDICPGIWVGNWEIDPGTTFDLTLRGYTGDASTTTLDGGSLAPVLIVGAGVSLTIDHLGLQNGVATWRDEDWNSSGGAIFASDAIVTLNGAYFTNNTAQEWGGAIAMRIGDPATSGLYVTDSSFVDNRASDNGGAIAVWSDDDDGPFEVTNSSFSDNRAPQMGGAVYVYGAGAVATITDSMFETNSASSARSAGGAIGADGGSVTLHVDGTTFSANTSGNDAGAIGMTADTSNLYVDSGTFSANTATDTGGAVRVSATTMDVYFTSCSFDANLSSTNAGAVEVDGGGYASFDTTAANNNSAGNAGGAYYFSEGMGSTLEVGLVNGSITTNRAGIAGGGGVYVSGARVDAVLVDFGEGTTDNDPDDVYPCSGTALGTSASFTLDGSSGHFCD